MESGKRQKAANRPRDKIYMFDVDGTLTASRKKITPEMEAFMREVRKHVFVGIVGGSDLPKQYEQLGEDLIHEYDYVFPENGLVAYREGQLINTMSLKKMYDQKDLNTFINFVLHYVADLDIPVKRGTFVEFRNGMINVCPIGRNCSQEERDEFEIYDKEHKIREKFVEVLQAKFSSFNFKYSIGGQISFDVFPQGWDKTFCLPFLEKDGFKEIHFFGDKTMKGGNDHEIFMSDKTIGHTVTNPDDTRAQLQELLKVQLKL